MAEGEMFKINDQVGIVIGDKHHKVEGFISEINGDLITVKDLGGIFTTVDKSKVSKIDILEVDASDMSRDDRIAMFHDIIKRASNTLGGYSRIGKANVVVQSDTLFEDIANGKDIVTNVQISNWPTIGEMEFSWDKNSYKDRSTFLLIGIKYLGKISHFRLVKWNNTNDM
jgi:hypothetical protein